MNTTEYNKLILPLVVPCRGYYNRSHGTASRDQSLQLPRLPAVPPRLVSGRQKITRVVLIQDLLEEGRVSFPQFFQTRDGWRQESDGEEPLPFRDRPRPEQAGGGILQKPRLLQSGKN